jgi:hypothetical protein
MYNTILLIVGFNMVKNISLVNQYINSLRILSYFSRNKKQYFKCQCVCNKEFVARTDSIKAGTTKSCGCLTGDIISNKNKLSNNLGAIRLVYRHYKANAKKRNINFFLSIEEFQKFIFNTCYYCGSAPKASKFTTSQKNRKDKELSYNGIDRVNNNIGYISDNCVTCCKICNSAKSDLSIEEFESWIAKLMEFRNVFKK